MGQRRWAAGVRHIEAAVFALPLVEGRAAHAALAAGIGDFLYLDADTALVAEFNALVEIEAAFSADVDRRR